MKRRLLAIILFVVMLSGVLPQAALAAATPPTTISAPENFAAANYGGLSAVCTLSAPDDLRALINQTPTERGYDMKILAQVDFKTDNGSWHHTSDWDDAATYTKYTLNFYNSLIGGVGGQFLGHQRLDFKTMFPSDTNVPVPAAFTSWDWYKSHALTLRARFSIVFNNNSIVFSDWSSEYVLSSSSKMDYKKILNDNAPTILSSTIETRGVNNVPWVVLQLTQHPDQTQMLNAASSDAMRTEVWLRKIGDTDFKKIGDVFFAQEKISLDVSAYFGKTSTNYEAQGYEAKVRYMIDERAYQQSGATTYNLLYSPFSNTLSYGMPAWSNASNWAATELEKADDAGLIPDILSGADMTKPINRQEFAAVAVRLYEKITGQIAVPVAVNPFTDSQYPEVLKAFNLGIVNGTSDTTFAPYDLTNREQVASMLSRTIRIMLPNGDYSTGGAPVFTDAKDISSWAIDHVLFMAKIGIIKGSDGKFMPRAVTTTQQAAGYASATREQALAMSVRILDIYGK